MYGSAKEEFEGGEGKEARLCTFSRWILQFFVEFGQLVCMAKDGQWAGGGGSLMWW